MSLIQAYKSDTDGKLFEDKKKYQAHLRKLATARRYDRKVHINKEKKIAFWRDNFWNKVKSIEQLKQACLIHAEALGLNSLANERFYGRKRPPGPPIIKHFNTFDFRFDQMVSNSHHCPHTGQTNWGRNKKGVPYGYPGFAGRIDYEVEWYSAWERWYPGGSDMWNETRMHSGSGGGGGFRAYSKKDPKGLQHFGYQIEIFLDDWPGLKEGYEKALVWRQLNGNKDRIDEVMNHLFPAEDYK